MSDTLPTLPGVDPPADVAAEALCELLADGIAALLGRRPTVTASWQRDMRLLLTKGPLGAVGDPVPAAQVTQVIEWTYRAETWWAERITSPKFLRKHYLRILAEARRAAKSAPRATPEVASAIGKLRGLRK